MLRVPIGGGPPVRLTNEPATLTAYSPDGQQLAVVVIDHATSREGMVAITNFRLQHERAGVKVHSPRRTRGANNSRISCAAGRGVRGQRGIGIRDARRPLTPCIPSPRRGSALPNRDVIVRQGEGTHR